MGTTHNSLIDLPAVFEMANDDRPHVGNEYADFLCSGDRYAGVPLYSLENVQDRKITRDDLEIRQPMS